MSRRLNHSRERSIDNSRISSDSLITRQIEASYSAVSGHFSRMATREKPSETLCMASCMNNIVDSNYTRTFMTILTLYVLFADDIRLVAFSLHQDDYFYAMACCAMSLFALEIVLCLYSQPGYRLSFYFYLDVLATLSLIPDIGWIWDPIIGSLGANSGSQSDQIRDAGRASRTGSRTTRIIRIVRLLRLVRLVKLYKNAKGTIERTSSKKYIRSDTTAFTIPKESRIGQKLGDLTTKRVIVLILGLLILLPLFELTFFTDTPKSWKYGMTVMERSKGADCFHVVLKEFVEYHTNDVRPLIFLSYLEHDFSIVWQSHTLPSDLRFAEKAYETQGSFVSIFDLRSDTRMEAGLNICQTIMISLILTLGAIYLTRDNNNLIIVPIEKMMDKVHRLARNPLAIGDQKMRDVYDCEEEGVPWFRWGKGRNHSELETSVLERTIMKIGALLALSLGEAGARTIAANLNVNDYFEPIIEGNKTMAIFSFCDIRNFTDVTEVLEEGVMVFVNEVASIVHHLADQHLGAANMNIGDAFLLVWKIDEEYILDEAEELRLLPCDYISNLSDLSLICILKIISQISVDQRLLKYQESHSITDRLPGYTVRLGFGLHVGWAIEGPIGSLMKIDASYLSPHVSITARLQEATKYYGVPLLISGMLHSFFSPLTQSLCRHIDTILIKGSNIVMRVYCYDVNLKKVRKPREGVYSLRKSKMKRKRLRKDMKETEFRAWELFSTSRKLKRLTPFNDTLFLHWFQAGLSNYESGDWTESRRHLIEALRLNPSDTPSKVLLSFMQTQNFESPAGWPGYRELREK